MGDCAQGSLSRMLIKAGTGTLDYTSGAHRLAFFQDLLVSKNDCHHPDLITGDLDEHAERARYGCNLHYGSIILATNPGDLAVLLPWITGGTFSGTTITPGTALSPYGVLSDKNPDLGDPEQPQDWRDVYVDRCVIFGRQHGPGGAPNWLVMQLWLAAKTKGRQAWPGGTSLTKTAAYAPFIFEDMTISLDSVERDIDEFMWEYNNNLQINHYNSLNPTKICQQKRTVRMVVKVPYDDDHDDLEDIPIAGIPGVVTVANGNVSTALTMAALQAPRGLPVIRGKTETHYTLQYAARMQSTTAVVSIANDSTV